MSRKPDGAVARETHISVRMTNAGAAEVDGVVKIQGKGRSHAMRTLIRLGLKAWARGER